MVSVLSVGPAGAGSGRRWRACGAEGGGAGMHGMHPLLQAGSPPAPFPAQAPDRTLPRLQQHPPGFCACCRTRRLPPQPDRQAAPAAPPPASTSGRPAASAAVRSSTAASRARLRSIAAKEAGAAVAPLRREVLAGERAPLLSGARSWSLRCPGQAGRGGLWGPPPRTARTRGGSTCGRGATRGGP